MKATTIQQLEALHKALRFCEPVSKSLQLKIYHKIINLN